MNVKKTTAKAAAAKPAAAVTTEEKKTETVETKVAAEAKAAETAKKAEPAAKKTAAKKTTKAAAKKTEPAENKTAEKEALKASVHIQFADKEYSADDIMNIMKDVWTYDLNQKEEDLKEAKLYVKPEESVVYYVVNGEISGKFAI